MGRQVQVTTQPKRAPAYYVDLGLTWPKALRATIPPALLALFEQELRIVYQIASELNWHREAVALGSGQSHHGCTCDDSSPPCLHGNVSPGSLPSQGGSGDPTAAMLSKLYELPERTHDGRLILQVVTSDEIVQADARFLHTLEQRKRRAVDKVRWERGDPTAPEPERGPGRHRVLVSDEPQRTADARG